MLGRFFSKIKNVVEFMQLDKSQKRLTFYSEGKNYWPHLEGLITQVLHQSNIPVCYLSSNVDDPGVTLEHPNFKAFLIDEGFVRNWLFENIETDVMVMTMPDIQQYQVNRSRHPVHYVYVQHSLVSLHMVYREGAFDHYDTIFCAGPHHVAEIRAIEAQRGQRAKRVFEHGYARLDAILREAVVKKDKAGGVLHILIAPSWGSEGTIETGLGRSIVARLIQEGHRVTLRPHPQTIRFAQPEVDLIVSEHKDNPRFNYENNVAGQRTLQESDLMISDWSGAAFDYALGLGKPVLFVDVPRKVNNPSYQAIALEPIEVSMREKLGRVLDLTADTLSLGSLSLEPALTRQLVFNVGRADEVGAKELIRMLREES